MFQIQNDNVQMNFDANNEMPQLVQSGDASPQVSVFSKIIFLCSESATDNQRTHRIREAQEPSAGN